MTNPQDSPTSSASTHDPEPRAPAFQRPAFVSEEVWTKKIPQTEDIWATRDEVSLAMEKIAEKEGLVPSRPWMTISLIVINVVLFGGAVALGVDPIQPDVQTLARWGANVGPAVIGGQWWRLFTAVFLHIGVIHLFFNLAVLWGIGGFVERLLGRVGFGVVFGLAGLGASLASILWDPEVVSAGASGAIFGLFGALLGYLAREPKCVPPGVRGRLALSSVGFLVYNMMHALNAQGIDIAGHLGGLVTGLFCGLFLAVPPTKDGAARRLGVSAWVLGSGLVVVGCLAFSLPSLSGDTGRLCLAGLAERRAMAHFEASAGKVRKGILTNAQFADSIEREVVPGLRDCRVRLEALAEVPRFSTEKLAAMVKVTKAEEEAYALMAHALRTGNDGEAALALKARADALTKFQADMKDLTP
jgi:rhomboid protease GluP